MGFRNNNDDEFRGRVIEASTECGAEEVESTMLQRTTAQSQIFETMRRSVEPDALNGGETGLDEARSSPSQRLTNPGLRGLSHHAMLPSSRARGLRKYKMVGSRGGGHPDRDRETPVLGEDWDEEMFRTMTSGGAWVGPWNGEGSERRRMVVPMRDSLVILPGRKGPGLFARRTREEGLTKKQRKNKRNRERRKRRKDRRASGGAGIEGRRGEGEEEAEEEKEVGEDEKLVVLYEGWSRDGGGDAGNDKAISFIGDKIVLISGSSTAWTAELVARSEVWRELRAITRLEDIFDGMEPEGQRVTVEGDRLENEERVTDESNGARVETGAVGGDSGGGRDENEGVREEEEEEEGKEDGENGMEPREEVEGKGKGKRKRQDDGEEDDGACYELEKQSRRRRMGRTGSEMGGSGRATGSNVKVEHMSRPTFDIPGSGGFLWGDYEEAYEDGWE